MKLTTSRKISVALSAVAAALLVGCGGGGGGSGGTAEPTNTSAITTSNAQTVAAQAISGTSAVSGGATSFVDMIPTAVSVSPTVTLRTGLIQGALHQLYKGLEVVPSSSSVATGVSGSSTISCPVSGTLTASANVANSSGLSDGDSMTITASNCVMFSNSDGTPGETLNGGYAVVFGNLTGAFGSTSSAWTATLAFTFKNFTLTENGVISGLNGDMTLKYAQSSYNVASYSSSGRWLQTTLSENGKTLINETLKSYSFSEDMNTTGYSNVNNYTFADNLAASYSAYTVKNVSPFKRNLYDAYPYTGSLTITAANNSKVTLTAMDNTNVKIEIDVNADGVVDNTINATWSQL